MPTPMTTAPLRIAVIEPDLLTRERVRRRLVTAAPHAVVTAFASAAQARHDSDVDLFVYAAAAPVEPAGESLAIAVREGVVLVDLADITHAVFDGALVTVHRRGRAPVLTTQTLQQLEQRLADGRFVRSHRRALLNLHAVRVLRAQDHGGYLAELDGGVHVPVSRQAARRLRRVLGLARAQPDSARGEARPLHPLRRTRGLPSPGDLESLRSPASLRVNALR